MPRRSVCLRFALAALTAGPAAAQDRRDYHCLELADRPGDGKPVCFDDVVRIKNLSYLQHLYPYPDKTCLWTRAGADDDAKWIIRKR